MEAISTTRSAPRFRPAPQLRSHEYVAEQIRRQITLGVLGDGEALPTERALTGIFGVGRATVQHALRILEAERLVETRRGRHGGSFVIAPGQTEESMAYLLVDLRRSRQKIAEVLDFRRALEPEAARVAAEDATPDELAGVADVCERGTHAASDSVPMRHDTDFHLRVAQASHNRFFIEAVEQVRLALSEALVALPESGLWHDRTAREHAAIVEALTRRDGGAAAAAMLRHVENTAKSIRALLNALR